MCVEGRGEEATRTSFEDLGRDVVEFGLELFK